MARMIVIGSDLHMRGYSFAAVDAGTGELRSSETVKATSAGHEQMLAWARAVGGDRVWAIEDCRHVSGKLERFLLARGERGPGAAAPDGWPTAGPAPGRQERPDRRAGRRQRSA